MNIRKDFAVESEDLTAYLKEDIAVLKIKGHVFDTITNLVEGGKVLSLIQRAERIPDVKALLILNEPGSFCEKEYERFLKRILDRNVEEFGEEEGNGVVHKIDRAREINILNRTVGQLVEFKKIAFMAMQGNIVTPFFGASLAVDFRFASEDVTFSMAHLKYGLHPSGALPFFLPRYVGHSKAVEILFSENPITAQHALDLGLINEIYPKQDFEKRCIEEVEKYCHLDTRVIHTTKLLANFSRVELRHYFDVEGALLH